MTNNPTPPDAARVDAMARLLWEARYVRMTVAMRERVWPQHVSDQERSELERMARAMVAASDERFIVLEAELAQARAVLAAEGERVAALEARVRELETALFTIASGSPPPDWNPDNLVWWLRTVARLALELPGWVDDPKAIARQQQPAAEGEEE